MRDDWKKTDLCGAWRLALMQNSEYRKRKSIPVTVEEIGREQNSMEARVPGNLELDLHRAGLLEDLFYGQNVLKARKLEALHMFYGRRFLYEKAEGTIPELTFEGLDTAAEIYLNGEKIGACENMFLIHRFPLTMLREGENEVVVHIIPACIAAREKGLSAMNFALKYNYETLRLRKSASMFGWDIMPRIVSGGMYRPVYLAERPREYLKQVYLMTDALRVEEKRAELTLFYEADIEGDDISEYSIVLQGYCGESHFEKSERLWFTAGKLQLSLENAKLWWPKGYGEQPLYAVEVRLERDGQILDSRRFRLGIRTVGLERTAVTDAAMNGRFQFTVNGKKIFILGTNMVPIDALHSRDRERLPRVLELLEDIGCNAVRCWGGGVYEEEELYDFCDEKGILIWQDFMMACAAYPADDSFGGIMEEETREIVRRLRQHASLLLWAGDNECDMGCFRRNPAGNRITREVIPRVAEYEDPVRPYLPSSPFVDEEAEALGEAYLPENHLWGPRDYYKSDYYQKSLCSFASEIGYHGCPSRASMERFLPPDRMWPWEDNDDWIVHGAGMETGAGGSYSYRVGLMARQVRNLFGRIPENLDDFVLASQISQAEALKFFIELFRTGRPRRTGIIWWNLIDGWPQFSDAVVDYYFTKKLAWYYIRQVQRETLLALREPEEGKQALVLVSDLEEDAEIRYSVTEWRTGQTVCQGAVTVPGGVSHLADILYRQGETAVYLLRWEQNGIGYMSHYLAGEPPFSLQDYREFLIDEYGYGKGGSGSESNIFSC